MSFPRAIFAPQLYAAPIPEWRVAPSDDAKHHLFLAFRTPPGNSPILRAGTGGQASAASLHSGPSLRER